MTYVLRGAADPVAGGQSRVTSLLAGDLSVSSTLRDHRTSLDFIREVLTLQISQCPNPALPKPVASSVPSASLSEAGPQEYWDNKNTGSFEVCTAIPAQLTLFFKGNSSRLAALQAIGLRMLRERENNPGPLGRRWTMWESSY